MTRSRRGSLDFPSHPFVRSVLGRVRLRCRGSIILMDVTIVLASWRSQRVDVRAKSETGRKGAAKKRRPPVCRPRQPDTGAVLWTVVVEQALSGQGCIDVRSYLVEVSWGLANRWMIAMKLFQTIYRNQFYTTTRCRIITGKYIRYYSRYFNFGLNSFARKKEFSFFQISTGYRNVIFFSFRHRRKDWEKINEERILLGRTIIPLNYTKNNRNE